MEEIVCFVFDMKLVMVTLALLIIKEDRGNRRGMGIEMKEGKSFSRISCCF